MKTAIFVEGQTELIFVREMLLRLFEYNIYIECFTLFTASKFYPTDYTAGYKEADFYFQIINTGGDNSVLSRIMKREQYLWNAGFDRIIGLRDMYSDTYKTETKGRQTIDAVINEKFKQGHQLQIQKNTTRPEQIFFRFAIMETETWLLAFPQLFARIDKRLNPSFIQKKLGFNLEVTDPETTFFHPTNQLKKILGLVDESYDKSKKIVNRLVIPLEKADYESLNSVDKCASFSDFYATIPQAISQ